VVRYKPGRRCLIAYDVELHGDGRPPEEATFLGKVRARRYGKSGYRLLKSFWDAGFGVDSPDGISVPEPLGTVPELRMWLQRGVPGKPAGELLAGEDGPALARRIAEAAHKLHRAPVPTPTRHSMEDELRILHECLPTMAVHQPGLEQRLNRILVAADRVGAATPEPITCGIHRDFYQDQVIVDGERLHLVDFDLFCSGDPALDVGNFMGHLTEQSLRTSGDPAALADVERAMEDRFVELAGEATRPAVQAYTTLTLVRHVYLSTRFPERQALTADLLELCGQRLGLS